MILVDANVWIAHFRRPDERLLHLLSAEGVLCHPMIVGELACGMIPRRAATLADLRDLPAARHATDEEVIAFIEARGLSGSGIGFLDAHLLAAATITPGTRIWTRDVRLDRAATRLGLRAYADA